MHQILQTEITSSPNFGDPILVMHQQCIIVV